VLETIRPESGDVLFLKPKCRDSKISIAIQRRIDPNSYVTELSFSHVAIVLDDIPALEAMPVDQSKVKSEKFGLPRTVELGKWTGSELRGGVRLVPIADVVMPAVNDNRGLAVLRTKNVGGEVSSTLNPTGSGRRAERRSENLAPVASVCAALGHFGGGAFRLGSERREQRRRERQRERRHA